MGNMTGGGGGLGGGGITGGVGGATLSGLGSFRIWHGPEPIETRGHRRIGTVTSFVTPTRWLLKWRLKRAARAGCRAAHALLGPSARVHASGEIHPHRGRDVKVLLHVDAHAEDFAGLDLKAAMAAFVAGYEGQLRESGLVFDRVRAPDIIP